MPARIWLVVLIQAVASMALADQGVDTGGPMGALVAPSDPRQILRKANDATRAVQFARYQFRVTGLGYLAGRVRETMGTAIVAGEQRHGLDRFRIEVGGDSPNGTEGEAFTVGSNGKLFFLIDPVKRVIHEDPNRAVMGERGYRARALVMREYSHPSPFQDEIDADTVELVGTRSVAGEACYEIRVAYRDGAAEAVWCFGTKDFLPRQVDRLYVNGKGERGARRTTISQLEVDPKLDWDPFVAIVPEGFEKTSEFASDSRRLW